MRKMLLCLWICAVLPLTGCVRVAGGADGELQIVTTIFPVYDFARAVAGETANLSMLVKPGASVHAYEPAPSDIQKIGAADVFLYIGGESDAWVDKLLSSMDTSHMTVVKLIDCVETVEEEEEEGHDHHGEAAYDEHIWTSPRNAMTMVGVIADALCQADAEGADVYRENAERYGEALRALDRTITEIVDGAARKLIVVADRFPFRYFTDAYGLTYRAAFGACDDQGDASPSVIAELVDTVKNENIPYIYYVELSTGNIAKLVSENTGAGLLLLHSCQNVTRDEFEAGATYLSLMERNAAHLQRGLQ